MADAATDVQHLIEALEIKEKRGRRMAVLYSALTLSVGLALTFWTAWQARTLRANEKELLSIKGEIDTQKQAAEDARNQLAKTRSAIEYVRFGINSSQAGNYPAAVEAYDRAIDLDPMNPVVFDLKGYSLLRQGRVQEALAALKRSVEIDPNYIWGHYNLALAFWTVGDRLNAVTEVRTVINLDPEFKNVIRNDVQFNKFNSSPAFRDLMK